MKDKRFLLFDLDGTVADSALGITDSVKYALGVMGVPVPADETLALFIGPPLRYSFTHYVALTESAAEEAIALYRKHYAAEGIKNCRLFPGVKEMLTAAKQSGKVNLLATSKPRVFAEQVLELLGVADRFDYVSAASFTPDLDSKPKIIANALAALSADKGASVMIGDRVYDIEGAAENGIDSIGVVNGSRFKDELLQSGATAVVDDFYALSDFLL